MKELNIENLHITVGDQQIVRGLTLRVPRREVQAFNRARRTWGRRALRFEQTWEPEFEFARCW